MQCHENGIKAALAGSLSVEHIIPLKKMQTDVIGFRTAICDNGNRVSGVLSAEKVQQILAQRIQETIEENRQFGSMLDSVSNGLQEAEYPFFFPAKEGCS